MDEKYLRDAIAAGRGVPLDGGWLFHASQARSAAKIVGAILAVDGNFVTVEKTRRELPQSARYAARSLFQVYCILPERFNAQGASQGVPEGNLR